MIRKAICLVLTLVFVLLGTGVKIENPRSMEFQARLDFTPREVERITLSNGIEVFLAEDHELPLMDIYISIRAGENRVPTEYSGLATLLADLIVEGGSKTVPKHAFEDSLKNLGASFSVSTIPMYSDFKLHLLSRHVDALLPLAVDALRNPLLPEGQLDLNKGQYLVTYHGRNDEPASAASRIFWKFIYGKESPWAREITPASLEKIDIDALEDFHKANYRPVQVMIGVTGDFEKEAIVGLLERVMGSWKEPDIEPYPELKMVTSSPEPGLYLVPWPEAVQSEIYMGHLSFLRSDPRYPAALIFSEIYGTSRFSRMRLIVREKHGLSYSPYGWVSGGLVEPGTFGTYCATKSSSTFETVNLILDIIESLKSGGVTDEDTKLAKSSWLASFPSRYADPGQVLLDRMIYAKYGYPLYFWDKMPDKIEPLTREDVQGFASGFLNPESLVILVLGDTALFDDSLKFSGEVRMVDRQVY